MERLTILGAPSVRSNDEKTMPTTGNDHSQTAAFDPSDRLDLVRSANQRFREFFARFGGVPVRGTHEEVQAMLQVERALRSVGALLKNDLHLARDPAMHDELARYRENLLRLRQELSAMERSASACQAKVFTRKEHLEAARAWCEAARSTR